MRIVYLHQYFNTPEMSGGTRSYEFARRFVDAGHEVHMITSNPARMGRPYETVEAGIRVTWIPVPYSNHMGKVSRLKAFFAFAVKSALIAARSPADVIFATSTPLTIAIPGIYAKWRQRIPMVFEVRDLWPEMPIALGVIKDPISTRLARFLESFAYRNADHVVALSPGMKTGVTSAGYPDSRISVIPNACDIERFRIDPDRGQSFRNKYDWLGERPLVTYTGTLGKINGVSYLADISAKIAEMDPEVRFLVVGDGREEEALRHHARQLGVLDRTFFMMPSIPKSDVPVVLSASSVCMSLFIDVPEMWSNSANKFFDALAAGRPIAINYRGWQADLITTNDCGVVLDATNVDLAAKQLLDYLADKDGRACAEHNASVVAEQQFARRRLAEQLETTLCNVARAAESRRGSSET